jgi:hypothetical protein
MIFMKVTGALLIQNAPGDVFRLTSITVSRG